MGRKREGGRGKREGGRQRALQRKHYRDELQLAREWDREQKKQMRAREKERWRGRDGGK